MRRRCLGTLKDVFWFDVSTVPHEEEVSHLHHFRRFTRNNDVTSAYPGLDLCYFEDPIDRFYLVKDADDLWRKLELDGRQLHHARGPRLVGRHSLEIFALLPSERNDFYTP